MLRARIKHGDTDDSTVKLRPVEPSELEKAWTDMEGFEVEIDVVGEKSICSAKLTVDQDRDEIRDVADGKREIKKLFSSEQEKLARQHLAALDWNTLTVLGPVHVRKWQVVPKQLDLEVTVEEWVLPDQSDLVELSVKSEPNKAGDAAEAFLNFLNGRGLDTEGEQQTKTKAALGYFTTGKGFR